MEVERNKLGLTIKDYKCPKCGFLHVSLFLKNLRLKRCRRCWTRFTWTPANQMEVLELPGILEP